MKKDTHKIKVGNCNLGDGKIYIQSMLKAPSYDIEGNVSQAVELERAGCDIIRAAIPDSDAVSLITAIKNAVAIPLVADIHFDYRLALAAIEAGVDKIRLNPGNIGDESRVKAVADACTMHNVPIRIGVNAGSLEHDLLQQYGAPTAQALTQSAMRHVRLLERYDFDKIVISIKSSDVATMIDAYRLLSQQCKYPLHLGVTEAGTERMGLIKSAIGIGSLLHDGIGDTIRVSLTADPVREIYAAQDILKSLNRMEGPQVISCPTCGRTRIDIVSLAQRVEDSLRGINKNIKVAVMGCAVNGPGEAKEADIGIAGGDGCAIIIRKGEILRKVPEEDILTELLHEIEKL